MNNKIYPQSAYLPQNLKTDQIADPYSVIYDFFDHSDLPDIRFTYWELFKAIVTGKFNKESYKYVRVSIVELYEQIRNLIEAAHVINEEYKEKRKLQVSSRIGIMHILKYSTKAPEEKILEILIEAAKPTRIYTLCINSNMDGEIFHDYLVVLPDNSRFPFDGLKKLIIEACSELPSILVSFIKEKQLIKNIDDGHIFYTQVCIEDNNLYESDEVDTLELPSEQSNYIDLVKNACAQFQVEIIST